jgi:drug/metabolite transporter superfamily protein YnfA
MKNFFRSMTSNVGIVGQLLNFLWQRKLWWLIPMVVVLLVFGLLLVFASASGIGPFIYTLF